VVVIAVDVGGRVEAEPCGGGSCRLVDQRKQAAAAPPHFTHRAGCVMAHAAPLSPSSGEEAKVEVYCFGLESSQQYPTVLLLYCSLVSLLT